MLRKILDRGHPLGLVGSMWATAGVEQASREIKKARSFARTPHTTEPTRGPLPFFLITVRRKTEKEHNTAVTNGLKTSRTREPFHNHALTPTIEDST